MERARRSLGDDADPNRPTLPVWAACDRLSGEQSRTETMASTPRNTVEDAFAVGLTCAICGQPSLFVQHLPNYPDFVTCRNCQSAFVVEDSGERVMYGKIPDDFPETQAFALRQWVWIEAVDRQARQEHPRVVAAPPPDLPDEPRDRLVEAPKPEEDVAEAPPETPPEELPGPDADWLAARLKVGELPAGVPIPTEPDPYRAGASAVLSADTTPADDTLPDWLRDEPAPAPPPPIERPEPAPTPPPPVGGMRVEVPPPGVATPAAVAAEPAGPEGEPPPGHRHRVSIRGDRVRMPVNACAHCQRAPAPDRLPIAGTLPQIGGGRRRTAFMVPLCRECSQRSRASSPEQRSARLMAHLTGALIGLVLVVILLALNVLSFGTLGFVLLGAAGLVGYGLTAAVMLGRAGRIPPTADAAYVRTTLRVLGDPDAPLTAFEWRNPGFAKRFYQANSTTASGEPTRIADATPSD